ncbi:MAG TPA: RNA polymerase sigma factor, partial [Solirubrobacteraceae bacterium]
MLGDDKLVGEVRSGSEAAFEVVYDRHHRGILAFCRHMLGTKEEAEDAVQHTFMAAYRDLVGSDKPIQLKAWLYTIARNRCLTVLRARRERPLDELDEPSTDGLAAEVQRRQDLRDLLRDVASLPEDQRAALVLAEVGDVSHDEIAAILDCPKQKVKALVFQARSSLTASRDARETPCEEIRTQLANLRGGSLRRNSLRRHLRECAGCRAFRTDMEAQRRALALVLPVAPAMGLKEAVLGAALGGGGGGAVAAGAGGGAAAGGGALAAGGGGGALATKALVTLAIAGAGAGGVAGVSAIGSDDEPKKDGSAFSVRPLRSDGPGGKQNGGDKGGGVSTRA